VDTYNEDEALSGFAVAFEDQVSYPIAGKVVGTEVQVKSVEVVYGRRELLAKCTRDNRKFDVALLDVHHCDDPDFERLLAAYRRWLDG
jgi:hypothetical protein